MSIAVTVTPATQVTVAITPVLNVSVTVTPLGEGTGTVFPPLQPVTLPATPATILSTC